MKRALIFALGSAVGAVLLTSGYDPNSCHGTIQEYGESVFCCDGDCIDNTFIGTPGACQNWTDMCTDTSTPPQCSSTQMVKQNTFDWVDAGVGYCYLPALQECSWTKNNWTWECCDCPPGYISAGGGVCNPPTSLGCVQCSESNETLTSYFQCVVSQGLPCDIVSSQNLQRYQLIRTLRSTTLLHSFPLRLR